MPSVLACVDRSAYATSVCDHASWFAGQLGAAIDVLHVTDGGPSRSWGMADPGLGRRSRPDPAGDAIRRLDDDGSPGARALVEAGSFVEVAARLGAGADLIVVGKRGENSVSDRQTLGEHVDQIIRATKEPICLVSQWFFPIARALVLLDADPSHRRAMEYAATNPALAGLAMDFALMGEGLSGAEEKLQAARSLVGDRKVDMYRLPQIRPDEAARHCLDRRASDLLILSREVLFADPGARLGKVENESFWRWRMPVLIC